MAKGMTYVIKLRILRRNDILDYWNKPNVIIKVLVRERQRIRVRKGDVTTEQRRRCEDAMFMALQMEEGATAKECMWYLEARKDREILPWRL